MFLCLILYLFVFVGASKPCNVRVVANGQVCVCNATYCDTLEDRLIPISPDEVIVVSTSPVRYNHYLCYVRFSY